MLHRLALRVLPSLALAVTDEPIRKRKRIVMLVPGLVAFGLYRFAKYAVSLAEPMTLLLVSGLFSLLTAVCAYRIGRRLEFRNMIRVDGLQRILWVAGWVGFVYGVQLSLLVLALLWLVGYDYMRHPDGPAMMALIIACTAVSRDAFEIGHVRFLQFTGRPFATFPDGRALRALLATSRLAVARWATIGLSACCILAVLAGAVVPPVFELFLQVALVSVTAGIVTLLAYMSGRQEEAGGGPGVMQVGWAELMKFWWWPGLAFAATYYLVVIGIFLFPLRQSGPLTRLLIVAAGAVGALMALYGYYLGHRRAVEDRVKQEVPESLLRCPFIAGILRRPSLNGSPAGLGIESSVSGSVQMENSAQKVGS